MKHQTSSLAVSAVELGNPRRRSDMIAVCPPPVRRLERASGAPTPGAPLPGRSAAS
jgi:hypothetical protein